MSEEEKSRDSQDQEKKEPQESFRVQVDVSQDRLEAYLTLVPQSQEPVFDMTLVRKALEEAAITFGLREELLESLEKEPRFEERLKVAEGVKPGEGKDGSIRYLFERDKPAAIYTGDRIAEIIPPEKGKQGMDVHGKALEADDTIQARVPKLVNVEHSADDRNMLVAAIDGYLELGDEALRVHPFFAMEQVKDEYEARVVVTKRLHRKDFGPEDLKKFLADSGIVFGIRENEVERIFSEGLYDKPVPVARGKRPVSARDGEVKYQFDTEVRPKIDERGNVDFKSLNLVQNVAQGDRLVEITEPVSGETGRTIYGEEVPTSEGVKPKLPKGTNTEPDPQNPDALISSIDGGVKLKGGKVQVDPVFQVKGDVDFSVGNIDFNGAVVIKGDVKSGFTVRATGDIEIGGIVEDAVIESEGDVFIKLGFIGRGEGRITSRGRVTAKYCVSQAIQAGSDINIIEYVMHSNIQSAGMLNVSDKKGLIVGGESSAVRGIEANIIGNQNYAPTAVFAGMDRETAQKIKQVRARMWQNAKHIKEIEKILGKFSRRQLIKKALPPDRVELIETLNRIKSKKLEIAESLSAALEELQEQGAVCEEAQVKVNGVVYPNTSISLCDKQTTVNDELKKVVFSYSGGEIVKSDIG